MNVTAGQLLTSQQSYRLAALSAIDKQQMIEAIVRGMHTRADRQRKRNVAKARQRR